MISTDRSKNLRRALATRTPGGTPGGGLAGEARGALAPSVVAARLSHDVLVGKITSAPIKLHAAALAGNVKAVRKILDSGLSPDADDDMKPGWRALHSAAERGHTEVTIARNRRRRRARPPPAPHHVDRASSTTWRRWWSY